MQSQVVPIKRLGRQRCLPLRAGRSLHPRPVVVVRTVAPTQGLPVQGWSLPDELSETHEGRLGSNAAATTSQPAQTSGQTSASQQFNWLRCWHAVAAIGELDAVRPNQIFMLGQQLAVWSDAPGKWSVVQDRCPHRLAPLSEGRVEGGQLMCSYHGWKFNSTGACTSIPQLGDPKASATALASPRSCVTSYPSQVLDGLLWVYGDPSPAGHAAAEGTVPATRVPELQDALENGSAAQHRRRTGWFTRDLPLRWDSLLENTLDPSHVPFAHHGVQGNRNKAAPTTTQLTTPVTAQMGFKALLQSGLSPTGMNMSFQPPGLVRYDGFVNFFVHMVPTRPGWTRLIYSSFESKDVPAKPVSFQFKLFKAALNLVDALPWLEHSIQRNAVLDGDTYMLHVQERILAQEGNQWKRAYYMPAAADSSVTAFRKWVDKHGGEIPTCEPDAVLPPEMSKRQVLDRWEQHTKNCASCKGAMHNIDIASTAAAALGSSAVLFLLVKAFATPDWFSQAAQQPLTAIIPVAIALACAQLYKVLQTFRAKFIFEDYVHADRN